MVFLIIYYLHVCGFGGMGPSEANFVYDSCKNIAAGKRKLGLEDS
jgi:hypothetical protein